MDELAKLKEHLEACKVSLQSLVDERPAASVSRIMEAEQAVKAAESEYIAAGLAFQPKVEAKPKAKKGVK